MKNFITSNRVKSFLWRSGMMALASILAILAENLNLLELSPAVVAVVGLVFGEISKSINKMIAEKKELGKTPVPLP